MGKGRDTPEKEEEEEKEEIHSSLGEISDMPQKRRSAEKGRERENP